MIGAPGSLKKRTPLVLVTLLALLLAYPGHASAQGSASASPDTSQYGDSSSPAMDVADIPSTVSDSVDDGTGSVNEAMTDQELSPAAASPAAGSAANPGGEGMTALPETGGASSSAPVAAVCAGASLLGCSLLLLRSISRRG